MRRLFLRLFDSGIHVSYSNICVTLSNILYLPFTMRAALRCTISSLSELYFWWGCQTVALRVDQLKLNHMYNIINGIAPSYLRSEISIAGHAGHVTRSGNRACFVPRLNSFAIKSFFYTECFSLCYSINK